MVSHTPIDWVDKLISDNKINIQVSYLFRKVRTRPPHLTTYRVNKRGQSNPTPIDGFNKLIANNIRLLVS